MRTGQIWRLPPRGPVAPCVRCCSSRIAVAISSERRMARCTRDQRRESEAAVTDLSGERMVSAREDREGGEGEREQRRRRVERGARVERRCDRGCALLFTSLRFLSTRSAIRRPSRSSRAAQQRAVQEDDGDDAALTLTTLVLTLVPLFPLQLLSFSLLLTVLSASQIEHAFTAHSTQLDDATDQRGGAGSRSVDCAHTEQQQHRTQPSRSLTLSVARCCSARIFPCVLVCMASLRFPRSQRMVSLAGQSSHCVPHRGA